MSAVDFSKLNKVTAKSFNDQKALIKKVLLGREIKCKTCNLLLSVIHPKQAGVPGIYCPKGCTSIELDIS
ncbi:hypothetical protein [Thalassomonas sp. M1454]|uniref:hypothetical protein n=1 Tax=Thalassomonas sp. M1454 TaxID=2594477 RepID=UPI00117D40A0|nr:hypothetical protein [Thalassomonas sp. M1454]TRX55851.1 hypothetical protein FNN08_09540 [Thalassomonas sp. M1454]